MDRRGKAIFDRDGIIVLKNFYSLREVEELKRAGDRLILEKPDNLESIFSTIEGETPQHNDKYFIESNDKVRYFMEKESDNGVPKINKVGHAIHAHIPLFKYYTYSMRIKQVCNILQLKHPTVFQSMYIYKNAHIGGAVKPHQDSTYLYTEPNSLHGFWIALEDANIENGCLWVAKGSHKSGVHRRLIRNPDKSSDKLLIYDSPEPTYSSSMFEPIVVNKGDTVLLHGNVVHKSEANTSDEGRPVYTFHVGEMSSGFSPDNWIQEGPEAPFLNLYETDPYTIT